MSKYIVTISERVLRQVKVEAANPQEADELAWQGQGEDLGEAEYNQFPDFDAEVETYEIAELETYLTKEVKNAKNKNN